jgi:ribosome biogenesis GTPase
MNIKSQRGLLVANYGNTLIVESQEGALIPCHMRQKLGTLVAGDEVEWESVEDEKGVVTALYPRQSLLSRFDKQEEKPFAANIDQLLILLAPSPKPHPTTLDRYLILAEHCHIQPLIGINKADLLSPNDTQDFAHLSFYRDLGYPVFYFSAKNHTGLSELLSQLHHKRTLMVGQSGVGKSSLLQSLVPDLSIRIQELSVKTRQGQQTTTTTTLYHLPESGDLVDSPGIHQFNLAHLPLSSLMKGFREFAPYIHQCKFRDCKHQQEPGCALQEALRTGHIQQYRWDSLQKIKDEIIPRL